MGTKYRGPSTFYVGYTLAPPEVVAASKEDSLKDLVLRIDNTENYPQGDCPLDFRYPRIQRGQNKIACHYSMVTEPENYALVYRNKAKTGLAYCKLGDIPCFHERVCDDAEMFPDNLLEEPGKSCLEIHASLFVGSIHSGTHNSLHREIHTMIFRKRGEEGGARIILGISAAGEPLDVNKVSVRPRACALSLLHLSGES